MLYDFKNSKGETVERWYDGTKHVPKRISIKGVRYTRVPSLDALRTEALIQKDIHFASRSRPRWDKNHKGEFNAQGQPLFSKRKEVEDLVARVNHTDPGYGGELEYE